MWVPVFICGPQLTVSPSQGFLTREMCYEELAFTLERVWV